MGNVTTSCPNNISSPDGNGLAIFVDGNTGVMKVKDVNGNTQPVSDFVGGCVGTISPFEYNANASGIQPILGSNNSSGNSATIGGGINNTASCNNTTIGGGCGNIASYYGSTISGGYNNTASGGSSTISGGYQNTASATNSSVGGGYCNITNSSHSVIGGGFRNIIQSPTNQNCSFGVTIGGGIGHNTNGGYFNTTLGNILGAITCCNAGRLSTISGGLRNCATGYLSTIGGGRYNIACGICSTIGGGSCNIACGTLSTVGGGYCNITNSRHSVLSGGNRNIIQSPTNECCSFGVTIGGGIGHNTIGGTLNANTGDLTGAITCCNAGKLSTIGGGLRNCATGACSFIGGGIYNTSGGSLSAILGGCGNTTGTCANAMIVGSNITADRVCTTFVNNLSIKNIPTSSVGLPSGSIYRSGNSVCIVI